MLLHFQVTTLFVRNLMLCTTEETIKDVFDCVARNGVTGVKKYTNYAFVHFDQREKARLGLIRVNSK